jgi:hypothetical protein
MESTSQVPTLRGQSPQDIGISSFFHAGPLDLNSLDLGPERSSVVPISKSPISTQTLKDLNGKHLINLTSIRICKDPGLSTEEMPTDSQAEATTHGMSPPTIPGGAEEGYLQLYFAHFHHRWPLIHRPAHTHNDGNHKLLFKFCMLMIGGWLSGTSESEEYALAMYDYLIPHISNVLVSKRST